MNPPFITLFIIAKNEEQNIAQCILSAKDIVQKIVVVNSRSTDGTARICRELGAEVYDRTFDGFTAQKNFALSKVKTEWALSLDADETLTPELAEEIKQAVQNKKINGYKLTRVNDFLGKRMRHSGMKAESILRLVRTKKAEFRGGLVHERLHVEGKTPRLKNVFVHHPYNNIESYFEKFNRYTTLAARTMFEQNKKVCLARIIATFPFEFARRYILKLGVLDGIRGLIWASFSAFYVFVKHMKLWYMWNRKTRND